MRFLLNAAALGATLALSSLAQAVTLENFDNYTGASPYEGWASGTLTPGPTSLEVNASGFGGAYVDFPDADVTGNNTLQLSASVKSGLAGFIAVIGDTSNHEKGYAFYGNPVGDYTFTRSLSAFNFSANVPGDLDLSNIAYVHIQVDPGGSSSPYDVTFNDLQIISTPEPASLAAVGLAATLLRRRRR